MERDSVSSQNQLSLIGRGILTCGRCWFIFDPSFASLRIWNVGIMESWNNVFWPTACRAYGSEKEMEKWDVGEIPFDMKLKMFISVGIPHPRLKPTFHYSTIPLFQA